MTTDHDKHGHRISMRNAIRNDPAVHTSVPPASTDDSGTTPAQTDE